MKEGREEREEENEEGSDGRAKPEATLPPRPPSPNPQCQQLTRSLLSVRLLLIGRLAGGGLTDHRVFLLL